MITSSGANACRYSPAPRTAPCTYGDAGYDVGDRFPARDGCNTCTCEEREFCPVIACGTGACDAAADGAGEIADAGDG